MIDLGIKKPGSTIRIPFSTFDSNDPQASAAITGFVVGDIRVYKDGSTTERASTAGFTATTSFDTLVGINEVVIDLSDNTTAGFYAAGSEYVVTVADVTLDAATVRKTIGRFVIGYPDAAHNTTIATLASQTSFTLTSGPAENDALNGCVVCIHDVASAVQAGYAVISDYVGATKTVTLTAGVTFTAAATDNISIYPPGNTNWVQGTAHTAQSGDSYPHSIRVKYLGLHGFGIFYNDGAANTNTVPGTDGTFDNPVSTPAAAATLAASLGVNRYYIINNSSMTLAATHEDWEFVGVGENSYNTVNFGSQDVDRSIFHNLTLEGTQGGTQRIEAIGCALQDPAAGVSTFHIDAERCGIVDDITLDTSNDNVFTNCYSLVAGGGTPIIRGSGAAGTIVINGFLGGIDLRDLSASHVLTVNIHGGQIIFDTSCNVNATVQLRGFFSFTDNTAGMNNLTRTADLVNRFDGVEGSTFDTSTDSLEAVRNRGDAAWTTGAGGTPPDLLQNTTIATLASQTSFTLTAGSADDDAYNNALIVVTDQTTSTQKAFGIISDYVGATKTVTLTADPAIFTMAVGDTVDVVAVPTSIADIQSRIPAVLVSGYMSSSIEAIDGNAALVNTLKDHIGADVLESDTAQAGSANTITLVAGSSAVDDYWNDFALHINGGTGSGQFARIEDYNGTTKVATIQTATGNWQTNPDATSTYVILSLGALTHVSEIHQAALTQITDELEANSTLPVNMTQISGSATAADNLEASALSIGVGTVNTANVASTTTTFQSADITEQTPDHMNGRIVIFYDSADPLWRQATSISDYAWDAVNSESMFTVVALTEAPGNADKFVIV